MASIVLCACVLVLYWCFLIPCYGTVAGDWLAVEKCSLYCYMYTMCMWILCVSVCACANVCAIHLYMCVMSLIKTYTSFYKGFLALFSSILYRPNIESSST